MSKLSRLVRKLIGKPRKGHPYLYEQTPEPRSFALYELDRKLVPFVGTQPGYFIEAGANDGVSQSNTLFFEKYFGWSGLLIEPIPELAERCRANRPGCTVVNSALVPLDFPDDQVEMHYCNLMSLVKGARKSEDADLEHVAAGCEVQGVESYALKVKAECLSDILDRHQVEQIDLLSLDVEGFELNALKGLDLDRHQPTWILVEANYRNEIDAFLLPWYDPVANLTESDILYRRKTMG